MPAAGAIGPSELVGALQQGVDDGAPGFSAAIATKRGIIWTGVAGLANLDDGAMIDEADLFAVASVTKSFVAVVALQLVEEGRLRLDAPLSDYVRDPVIARIANARTATIRDILSHYSGVPSWEDMPAWIRDARGAKADSARLWRNTDPLRYIFDVPATGSPGERYAYSNSNYALIAMAIEAVSRRRLIEEIRSRILTPLGLHDIFMEGSEPIPRHRRLHRYHYATPAFIVTAGLAPGFRMVRPGLIDIGTIDTSWDWAAGAIIATARDLACLARALRDGYLLKPKTMTLATQWRPADDWGVGLGLFRMVNKHGVFIGHTGNTLGGTGAFGWTEQGDAVIVALSNVGASHSGRSGPNGSKMTINSPFADLAVRFAAQ